MFNFSITVVTAVKYSAMNVQRSRCLYQRLQNLLEFVTLVALPYNFAFPQTDTRGNKFDFQSNLVAYLHEDVNIHSVRFFTEACSPLCNGSAQWANLFLHETVLSNSCTVLLEAARFIQLINENCLFG